LTFQRPKTQDMKTVFIPCRAVVAPGPISEAILKGVKEKSVCLVTTAQFVHMLDEVKKTLEDPRLKTEDRKQVTVNLGRPNPGQVLGCDARAACGGKAECVVYIGTGRFHALRAAVEADKPVYMVRPTGEVEKVSKRDVMAFQKKRYARLSKLEDAGTVGIVVSTKPGQEKMKDALQIQSKLRKQGKKAFIFAANEIKPQNLDGFKVDAWVSTACPRIAEDRFEKPVVDSYEL